MKVASIELGQVTWLVDYRSNAGRIYLPEAIPLLIGRYGFVKSPTIEEILQPNFIPVFEHGRFEDSVIRRFAIYTDGLISDAAAGTEVAEAFLQDFLNWMEVEFDSKILGFSQELRGYDSHIVAQLRTDMGSKISFVNQIADELLSIMSNYEQPAYAYHSSGFTLEADPAEIKPGFASKFSIERRANQHFEKDLYFCCAPLKSEDHIKILEKLESIV